MKVLFIACFFPIFFALTACTTWKSTTAVSVKSESAKYGNQTIELNRTLDASK